MADFTAMQVFKDPLYVIAVYRKLLGTVDFLNLFAQP